MASGFCKLTGEYGTLVKAHILPKALTSPDDGGHFVQSGRDDPPIKRWTSWYDPALVTRAGEDILASYDNHAIAILRSAKLVWSGWGDDETLSSEDHLLIPNQPGYGARKIQGYDGRSLRMFFLSLLWRAAVSDLPEFKEISLHSSDVRRLRRMLVERDHTPLHRFPICLIQLSTKGLGHNLTPLSQRKPRDAFKPNGSTIPIFRFYFDGLIAHIHHESSPKEIEEMGSMFLGGSDEIIVTTVSFERSWQSENMSELVREAETRWPDRLARISGYLPRR